MSSAAARSFSKPACWLTSRGDPPREVSQSVPLPSPRGEAQYILKNCHTRDLAAAREWREQILVDTGRQRDELTRRARRECLEDGGVQVPTRRKHRQVPALAAQRSGIPSFTPPRA